MFRKASFRSRQVISAMVFVVNSIGSLSMIIVRNTQKIRNETTERTYSDLASQISAVRTKDHLPPRQKYDIILFIACGVIAGLCFAAISIYFVRRQFVRHGKSSSSNWTEIGAQTTDEEYKNLCRHHAAIKSEDADFTRGTRDAQTNSSSVNSSNGHYWDGRLQCSEIDVALTQIDIATGHRILSYMEEHLSDRVKLSEEWASLQNYEPDVTSTIVAFKHMDKNRYSDILPYDYNRFIIKSCSNQSIVQDVSGQKRAMGSDYINASKIIDHDPRYPLYIATQGPLLETIENFWTMVWQSNSNTIVMLTNLEELSGPDPQTDSVSQCAKYWPEKCAKDDSATIQFGIFKIHLISEHTWSDDYLIRCFYLRNMITTETRTISQFHFTSWNGFGDGIPHVVKERQLQPNNDSISAIKVLLEFRRKVNKSFNGSQPIVVHCNDGIGRTGTYCLIDMVLRRIERRQGKEIDITATLEYLRDQRMGMVKTQAQFEFALQVTAEEISGILENFPQMTK